MPIIGFKRDFGPSGVYLNPKPNNLKLYSRPQTLNPQPEALYTLNRRKNLSAPSTELYGGHKNQRHFSSDLDTIRV